MFGYSSGVIGLQLFLNKKFDASKWSAKKYMEDPASVEPLVGEHNLPLLQFDKEGEFTYHCKIHGKTMSGTVVVKPAGAN